MRIKSHGFDFLQCYCEGDGVEFVSNAADAEFVLTMNNAGNDEVVQEARRIADDAKKPLCFWTIEDPNSCLYFLSQARMADYAFTSDRELIPWYREQLGHQRIYWLPLAASPAYDYPMPLAEDATDFVLSLNWYRNQARKWGDETVILPLARAGYSMAIFSYEEPPYEELKKFWRGPTSCRTVSEQYSHGRIVLGNNNQRSGFDGIEKTVMTSMRSFQALACGKPFLTPHSDAYEALGFEQGRHLVWEETIGETLADASILNQDQLRDKECPSYSVASGMACRGRQLVLERHTYRHRLERIYSAINGTAIPEVWWAYSTEAKA